MLTVILFSYIVGKTEIISDSSIYLTESQLHAESDNCTAVAKQGNNIFMIQKQFHALNIDVIFMQT